MTDDKSDLTEKIQKDLVQAFKAKDELKLSVLRMLKTAILEKEKESGQPPNNKKLFEIIQSEIKKRDHASKEYQKAGRDELAKKEIREKKILIQYLPKQLTEQELEKIINKVIEKTNAQSLKQIGKVIGSVITETQGRASGNLISQLVKQKLQLNSKGKSESSPNNQTNHG